LFRRPAPVLALLYLFVFMINRQKEPASALIAEQKKNLLNAVASLFIMMGML
jgi:hypothetical protein